MGHTEENLILVVDDNADLRELIAEILALHGFLVKEADNGQSALDLIEQSTIPPSLILSDLAMPVMDGGRLIRRLKQDPRFEQVPVVFITAYDLPAPAGAAATLRKPFEPAALIAVIRRFTASQGQKRLAAREETLPEIHAEVRLKPANSEESRSRRKLEPERERGQASAEA